MKRKPSQPNHKVKYLVYFMCFMCFALIHTNVKAANPIELLSVDYDEEMVMIDPTTNSRVLYSFDTKSWIPLTQYDGVWLIDISSLSKTRTANIYLQGDGQTDTLHIVRNKQDAAPFKGVYCGIDDAIAPSVGSASAVAIVDSTTKKSYATIKTIEHKSFTNAAWNTSDEKNIDVAKLEAFGGKLHLRSSGSSASAIEGGKAIVKVTQPSKMITVTVPKKARKTATKLSAAKAVINGVNKTFVYVVSTTETKNDGLFSGSIAGQTYYADVTSQADGTVDKIDWSTVYTINQVDTKQSSISLLDFPRYALRFRVYVPATAKAPASLPTDIATPLASTYGAISDNISFDFASESILINDLGNEKAYEYTIIANIASGPSTPTAKTVWTALKADKTSLTTKLNALTKDSTLYLRKKGYDTTKTSPLFDIPSQYIAYSILPRPVFTDTPRLDTVKEVLTMRIASGLSEIEIATDAAFTSSDSSAQYTLLPATKAAISFPLQTFAGSKMYFRTKVILPPGGTPVISPGGIFYSGGALASKTLNMTIPGRADKLNPTYNFYNRRTNEMTFSKGTEFVVADSLADALASTSWSYVGAYAGKVAYTSIAGIGPIGSTNNVYIRQRATAITLASVPLEITFAYTATPAITFDSTTYTLQGINNTMCYSLDGGISWTNAPGNDYILSTAEQAMLTSANGIQVKFITDVDDFAVLHIPII